MTQTFQRLLAGVGLAAIIALPFGFQAMPMAHAAETGELEGDDILSEDFGDNTGLGQGDLQETIGQLIRVLLGFLGVVAVVIILLGGFKWMTAGGNDEKVAEAKRLIIAGIIGLAIILAAYAIASFVISSIIGATQG